MEYLSIVHIYIIDMHKYYTYNKYIQEEQMRTTLNISDKLMKSWIVLHPANPRPVIY